MAVKIRLRRMGQKKAPFYRIVVSDSRSPRDGKFIEEIGTYDPTKDPSEYHVNEDLAKKWLANGAQPTDTVARIFKNAGTYDLFGNYGDEVYAYGSNGEDCANSYFVDTYSMTYPSEDRAKIWENIMSDEKYVYWEKTPHLTAKLNYYAECIRQNFDSTGWNDVRWEKYMNI